MEANVFLTSSYKVPLLETLFTKKDLFH